MSIKYNKDRKDLYYLDPGVYRPEIACTTFLKGNLHKVLKKNENSEKLIERVTAIFSTFASDIPQTGTHPDSEESDGLVTLLVPTRHPSTPVILC